MLYRPGLLGRLPCPMDWYAGSGPPTISDDFSAGLAAGWTFTRASANATNCLYTDSVSAPAFTTYAANTPRFLDFGLLMEPTRTNYFLNSEAPVAGNPSITLAVGNYVLWYHGTAASVGMSGVTATTVPFSGTATVGVPFAFQVTAAGTIAVNIPVGVTRVQVENGSSPTSYIPTTGVTATRADDRLNKNYFGGQINASQSTYWVEFVAGWTHFPDVLKTDPSQRLMTVGNGSYTSNNNTEQIQLTDISGTTDYMQYSAYNAAGSSVAGSISMSLPRLLGNVSRVAVSVDQFANALAGDYKAGGKTQSSYRPTSPLVITLGGGGGGGSGGNHVAFNGFIRGFKYWPTAMPDAELKECTGPGYYSGPAVFDYSFMGGASAFPRRWLHTRGTFTGVPTDSVYDDAPGSTFNTYTGNTPKMTPRGLLMDVTHSNLFPNGTNPVTGNSGGLSVQTFCCWMIGTGSVTVTPNTAAGSGFGTVTQGNPIWIVITVAGTVTCTMSGSVNRFQIEQQGANLAGAVLPRTYLQSTTSAQTSGGEWATIPTANWYNNEQGTYVIDFAMFGYTSSWFLFSAWSGSDNLNREQIFNLINAPAVAPTMNFRANTITGGVNLGGVDSMPVVGGVDLIASRVHKIALSVGPARRVIVLNGQIKQDWVPGFTTNVAPRPTYPTLFGIGTDATTATGVGRGNGYYRRVRYYDYMMTDAQLIALTDGGTSTVDYKFTSALPSGFVFSRASPGSYYDVNGVLQTAGNDVPRFDYDPVTHMPLGLLIEEARTNMMLSSAAPNTQSVAVTAQAYTLSFYGTGTVTLSGASTGSLVGTGAFPRRVSLTFTPTAGTLTMTMSGSVQNAQLEAGPYVTSYIATTAAAATRAADTCYMATDANFSQTQGTLQAEWMITNRLAVGAAFIPVLCELDDGATSNVIVLRLANPSLHSAGVFRSGANIGGVNSVNSFSQSQVMKSALTYQGTTLRVCGQGGAVGLVTLSNIPNTFNRLSIGSGRVNPLNGYIRRVRYWNRALSDAELQDATV